MASPCSSMVDPGLPDGIAKATTEAFAIAENWSDSGAFKKAVRKGVPASRREEVWKKVSGGEALAASRGNVLEIGMKDTFPVPVAFNEDEPGKGFYPSHNTIPTFGGKIEHLELLRLNSKGQHWHGLILCALAQTNPSVSYCPCLPSLAATFLVYMEPEQAYSCLSSVLRASGSNTKHSRKLTNEDMKNQDEAELCFRYLALNRRSWRAMAHIFINMAEEKISKSKAMTAVRAMRLTGPLLEAVEEWFSSLFLCVLPLEWVFRLIDALLLEGSKILIRFAVATLRCLGRVLATATTPDEAETILKEAKTHISERGEEYFKKAFALNIKRAELDEEEEKIRSGAKNLAEGRFQDPVYGITFRPKFEESTILAGYPEWEQIFQWTPASLITEGFKLRFSTKTFGFSLTTMYEELWKPGEDRDELRVMVLVKAQPVPTPIQVKAAESDPDLAKQLKEPQRFGCILSGLKHPDVSGSGGDGRSCVFTLSDDGAVRFLANPEADDGSPKAEGEEEEAAASGKHKLQYSKTTKVSFEVGFGSEGPAIGLASDLNQGRTAKTATYGNEPLCPTSPYDILALETFTFS